MSLASVSTVAGDEGCGAPARVARESLGGRTAAFGARFCATSGGHQETHGVTDVAAESYSDSPVASGALRCRPAGGRRRRRMSAADKRSDDEPGRLPTVLFTPSSPGCGDRAPSGRSAEAAGKAIPRTNVTGSTTTITAPSSAAMVSSGRLGTNVFGLSSSHRSDANANAATVSCAPARNRSGSPIRDRTRLKMMAPRAIPIRKTPRIIVNT